MTNLTHASNRLCRKLTRTLKGGAPINPKSQSLLLWLIVIVAAAVFTIRGPLHSSSAYANDFAAPYTSARLWLHHQDPYDPVAFWPAWQAAGAPLHAAGGGPIYANPSSTHSVYPPPSVVVLAPFALLSWPAACLALTALTTTLYLLSICLLSRLLPGNWIGPRKPAFLAIGLLFAPTHSALHVSNVTALAASLLLLALYIALRSNHRYTPGAPSMPGAPFMQLHRMSGHRAEARPLASAEPLPSIVTTATLLTLSLCIKPTLAPLVLLYLLFRRAWKTLTITLALTAAITAAFQLLQPNLDWLQSLRANIAFLFHAGVADLAERNLTRSDRIDLQLPAYLLTHSRNAAAAIATIVTLVLLALCCKAAAKDPVHAIPATINPSQNNSAQGSRPTFALDRDLLLLSTLLVLGLLPFYQRFYSAMLLLLPVLWALSNLGLPRTRWVLALSCIFLVNTSVLPRRIGLQSHNRLLEILLTPHLCWIVLLLVLLLLLAMRRLPAIPAITAPPLTP